ncbi:MAG: hypothetical protein HQL44_09545 [Alphaproteobacteria bacterium]|nr:hypothetical protein [Alphaproteobacteria bacterium]
MPSVIFGLLTVALGLWGLTAWWWSVTEFLRGALPIALIFLGLVALAAGVRTVRKPGGKAAGKAEAEEEI